MSKWKSLRHWVLAGMAIGMAETVPGISGGTVALLVGVYERLVSALAAFSPGRLLQQFRRRDFGQMDLVFLSVLGLSMLAAAWLLSHPLSLLYSQFEQPFRLALAALILVALVPLLLRLPNRPATWVALLAGLTVSAFWAIGWQSDLTAEPQTLMLAGLGAGTLMVLPGVSGGYLLLLLGLYGEVIAALSRLDFGILLPLAAGVAVGAIFCARLVGYLLQRAGEGARAFLCGLVLGSPLAVLPGREQLPPAALLAGLGVLLTALGLFWLLRRRVLILPLLLPALLIAGEPAAAADDKDVGWVSYRVEKGENLTMIANLYGVSVADMIRWNRMASPYRIFPGQRLQLPVGSRARLHRVKKDETLSGIALKYRTFIKRLQRMNGLASANLIYPGQVLRLAPELKPLSHRVRRGETLWALALRYNLELEELMRINGLKRGATIHPGQQLQLAGAAGRAVARPAAPKKKAPPPPKVVAAPRPADPMRWVWPADGALNERFHPARHKGITIGGARGAEVRAAAAGEVRYAGNGLFRDYGWLIILGHGRYLSVYAHNDEILVREGEKVKAGQRIARMGNTGTDSVKLHFQVKFRGRPTDPLSLLPTRERDRISVSDTDASL